MDKDQQREIVKGMTSGIADEITAAIDDGRIPEEWDGHELRCLVEEKACRYSERSAIRQFKGGLRARAYRNTVIVNNI